MTARDRLVGEYLDQLREAAQILPVQERTELVAEIEAHIAESIPARATVANVSTALEALGTPASIVASAAGGRELPPIPSTPTLQPAPQMQYVTAPPTRGGRELAAVILLVVGPFLWALGWIVGVALLISSPLWTTRQKVLGATLLPAEAFLAFLAFVPLSLAHSGAAETCSSPSPIERICSVVSEASNGIPWLLLLFPIFGLLVPALVSIHLYREAGKAEVRLAPERLWQR